jgi:SepF-like predicted cell division protein (DUF552 family)
MAHPPLYVKALPLQELDDVEVIKAEIRTGNILIVRITPLARKSVDETKLAITELTDHVKSVGGDIARLGEERIVITPSGVRIWRRETANSETSIPSAPLQKETIPGSS